MTKKITYVTTVTAKDQHHGPQQAPDQVLEHRVGLLAREVADSDATLVLFYAHT